jgi:hypothetical protein
MMSDEIPLSSAESPPLVRGYTLALGIFAVFCALSAIISYSMAENPDSDPSLRWAHILMARLEIAFAVITGLVTYLRARGSQFALGATTAFNILIALYLPVGTAAFLYWWFSKARA